MVVAFPRHSYLLVWFRLSKYPETTKKLKQRRMNVDALTFIQRCFDVFACWVQTNMLLYPPLTESRVCQTINELYQFHGL